MSKKVSVVLGGSMGMGLACAHALGKNGPLVIFGRTAGGLEKAADELNRAGIEVYTFQGDVSKFEDVKAVADFAQTKGEVTYVVNSAGLNGTAANVDLKKIMEVNAYGAINVVQAFYPILKEGAAVVLFSSEGRYQLSYCETDAMRDVYNTWRNHDEFIDKMLEIVPNVDQYQLDWAYLVAKEFVAWFTKVNVVRFGRKGCRINSVTPGTYNTRMVEQIRRDQPELIPALESRTPLGHLGRPYEMANVVDFLCSEKACYVTGENINVDGGDIPAVISPYWGKDQILDD